MSESTKNINVPLWELKEIANTLRMVANALDSPKRESCLDRNVMRSWNHVVDLINGKERFPPENIDYYMKVGQIPNINEQEIDMKQTLEQAAIEAVENHYGMDYDGKIHEMYILREAFEAGAEWQAKQSPWTLVKDKLPDESELVLCRMVSNEAIVSGFIFISPDGLPCVATLPSFEFEDYGGYVCDMWMPIPKFNE